MTGANERPRSSRRIFIELMVVEFWFPENANSEKNVVVCLPGQHLQAAVLGAFQPHRQPSCRYRAGSDVRVASPVRPRLFVRQGPGPPSPCTHAGITVILWL